jgi:hypothetical protein
LKSGKSGDIFIHIVGSPDKKTFVAVAGYLVYRVATDGTGFQMGQDFQFFVQFQLFVQQLNQLLEAACAHNASHSGQQAGLVLSLASLDSRKSV